MYRNFHDAHIVCALSFYLVKKLFFNQFFIINALSTP